MKTATQLEMSAMTPQDAFGPKGVTVTMAGHVVTVRRDGHDWTVTDCDGNEKVIVTDDLEFVERHVGIWFDGGNVGAQ